MIGSLSGSARVAVIPRSWTNEQRNYGSSAVGPRLRLSEPPRESPTWRAATTAPGHAGRRPRRSLDRDLHAERDGPGAAGRLPLALTRSYRSADTKVWAFGLGTIMGYDEYLLTTSSTVLTYVYHGDAPTQFVQQPDGSYTNTTVPAFRARRSPTTPARGRGSSGTRRAALSALRCSPTRGCRRRSATERQPADDHPGRGDEPHGDHRRYGAAMGRDARLRLRLPRGERDDPLGRTVSYQYDASGRLVRVTNPAGGVTQYAYDSQHRMTTITDARGIRGGSRRA